MDIAIESADAADPDKLRAFLVKAWQSEVVVAHGDRLHPARLPGFVAMASGHIVGHASYRTADGACEVTSIAADPRRRGIGSQLMAAVIGEARRRGCHRVWLTTTNDNLDALRFYQRRGFRLTKLRTGAVDQARAALKPEIPTIGSHGIRMRDELDLEFSL